MIIYGWGNFNRRDHSLVRSSCRSCGRPGYLKSYTSSKFFTLYFIPIIPLGSQKVVQDCPHCNQAIGMSVGKWKKLHKTELSKVLAEYDAHPSSPEAAKALLGTCVHVQDRATVRRVGPQIRATFARDAEVLGFLAGTYSYLCLDADADAVYLEAMALSDDEALAKEADAHIELQRLPKPVPPNRLLQSLPVLIVPGVLLFLLLGFLQDTVSSGIDHGYVISGLDRPYSVVINGTRVTLKPHGLVATKALEIGRNEITPVEGETFPEARTFEIDVPWGKRALSKSTVVVNPDQAAVILWEKAGYAYPKAPDDAGEYEARAGQLVHVHEDIDFRFKEFPAQVSVPSGGGVVYRTRLSDASSFELGRVVNLLMTSGGPEGLAGYLRARLAGGDEETSIIHLSSRFLPQGEFLRLAEAKLTVRPTLIEWHRAYQTLVEDTPDGEGLAAKYKAFADAAPDDSTLHYLYGRVIDDPAESVPVFERAARMEQPSGYAANALAYHFILDGDFATAKKWSEEARRIEPENTYFQHLRVSALYGLGEFAEARREVGDPLVASENRLNAFYAHLYRVGKSGEAGSMKSEIARFIARARAADGMTDADAGFTTAYLESAVAIATGDRGQFLACAARIQGPAYALQHALVAGNLDGALKLEAATPDGIGMSERLVLHLLLDRAGRKDEAQAQLAKAIATLQSGTADEKRWATWLSGGEAPTVNEAAHTCPDLDMHPLFLTALAVRHPARAAEYLERAAAIQWIDTFATLALDASTPPKG